MIRILAAFLFSLFASAALAQTPVVPCVSAVDHSRCASEVAPIPSTATESSHLFKAAPATMVGFQVNNWSTSSGLTVMVFDAATVPSNGAVTACTSSLANTSCLVKWYGVPPAPSASQPSTLGVNWAPGPNLHLLNGLVIACSSTGPTTLTLSSNCTFSAEIQ